MQGIADSVQHKGIIPRAFEHIFEAIETSDNVKYLVHASYLEIYNEEIRDLLGKDVKKRLDLKEHPEHGLYVSGKSWKSGMSIFYVSLLILAFKAVMHKHKRKKT
jgi:kinesin family protein 3/17